MAGKFFKPLRELLEAIIKLNVDEIALDISRTSTFKKLVITLNTEGLPTSQLFELGEDSEGKTLESIGGGYSPFTIQEKSRKNQPTDRVTLKDTGEFYRTFDVRPFRGGFTIVADTLKDGQDLENRWGDDIVGLNEDNTNLIIEFYKDRIIEQVRRNIKGS